MMNLKTKATQHAALEIEKKGVRIAAEEMSKQYSKYIHKNRTEGDCQLVTAVNAYYHLTGKTITPKRYDKFIDMVGCRCGSAISIKNVWKQLKIKPVATFLTLGSQSKSDDKKFHNKSMEKMLSEGYPIEITTNTLQYGRHSILAIKYNKEVNAVRVLNFDACTTGEGWIFYYDLSYKTTIQHGVSVCCCEPKCGKEDKRWTARVFDKRKIK